MTIRILIADDHALVRRGLQDLIQSERGFKVVGEAQDSSETLRLVAALHPKVVLLDISMPGIGGINVIHQLQQFDPHPSVLVLTAHEDESLLQEAFRAGAKGYIVKRAADSELINALRAVARGDVYVHPSMTSALLQTLVAPPASGENEAVEVETLTPREQEILRLLAQGYTNRQIAEELFISVRTVETHRANLMAKLNLHTRLDLVRYAKLNSLL